VAALAALLAVALVMVAAVAAPAHSQEDAPGDAPAEDTGAESPPEQDPEPSDAPVEDGPQDPEPSDAPVEDGPQDPAGEAAGDEASEAPQTALGPSFIAVAGGWRPPVPPDWPLALVPPAPLVGRPSLEALLGTDRPPCPPWPSNPFIDADPYPGGWCREPRYWIVAVACGPSHGDAGSTVRFNADPAVVGNLTLAEVCDSLAGVGTCRTAGHGRPEGEEPPETEDTPETGSELGADAAASTDAGGAPALPLVASDGASVESACALRWPSGSWYQYSRRDPVTGDVTISGGRHTGAWLGSPHRTAAAAPSFELRCTAGRLRAMVHTGGTLTGPYGPTSSYRQRIPVDYRIGGSARFQDWTGLGDAAGLSSGVSLPPLFAADFAGLVAANLSGEFLFRSYGPDGAAFGTAVFDLAAVGEIVGAMRRDCPAFAVAAPRSDASDAAPAPEES